MRDRYEDQVDDGNRKYRRDTTDKWIHVDPLAGTGLSENDPHPEIRD